MKTLDHEQFEGAAELAQINMKIAEGRALISDLEASKASFLEDQEKELVERLKRVLDGSKDLIVQIGENHDELVKYRREVAVYVEDLRCFVESVNKTKSDLVAFFEQENNKLDARIAEVDAMTQESKRQRALLRGEMEGIKVLRGNYNKDAARLKDGWESLERATKELTAK